MKVEHPREPVWLDPTPGNLAEADQVKQMAVDAVRGAKYALVLVQDADGDNRILSVADGDFRDVAQFFLDSTVAQFHLAVEATGATPLELVAHVLTHLPSNGVGK